MLAMIVGNIFLGLSIAAPVGPINIEIIKRGLSFGFWPALFVGLGGMSSDLLLMGAMFVGMSAVLSITWVKILLMCLGAVVYYIVAGQAFARLRLWKIKHTISVGEMIVL